MECRTLDIPVRGHGRYGAWRRLYLRRFVGRLVQIGFLSAADEPEPHPHGVEYNDDDRECEDYREDPVHRCVRDYLCGLIDGLGPGVDFAGVVCLNGLGPLLEEADPGVRGEDLVPARRERHDGVPRERHQRHPDVLQLAHLYEDWWRPLEPRRPGAGWRCRRAGRAG